MVSIKEFGKSKKREKNLSLNNWPLSRPVSGPSCAASPGRTITEHGKGIQRKRKTPRKQTGSICHLWLELMSGERGY